jgi:transposase
MKKITPKQRKSSYDKVDNFTKGRIYQYSLDFPDYSLRKIGKHFDLNHKRITSILYAINNPRNQPCKKRGPKMLLKDEDWPCVKKWIGNEDVYTLSDIKKKLSEENSVSASCETVRRFLKLHDYRAYVRQKRPILTDRHKRLRLEYARKYQFWNVERWKSVIFSDESKIGRFGDDGRRFAWVEKGKSAFNKRCRKPSVKFDSGSIMVWGCIGWKGVGWSSLVSGKMNSDYYIDILEENLFPSVPLILRKSDHRSWYFLQDGATCHTSRKTKAYLKEKNVKLIKHPPNSPDLNCIEHLWYLLKCDIKRSSKPKNANELWEAFSKSWEKFEKCELIKKLIRSMPNRIQEVLQQKGGYSSY